jgi:hypothetical protein
VPVFSVRATHNVSRYFPFLERTEEYVLKNRSHVTPSFFYINASTCFRRGGGTGGIPGLWGHYDLKDVIASLQTVNPAADPVFCATGSHDLSGKPMPFKVNGKIRGCGLSLNYEQNLRWLGLQLGVWVPFVSINTTSRFSFNPEQDDLTFNGCMLPAQARAELWDTADKIRRTTHKMIGFKGNEWTETGFGDIDLHLRWNRRFDHIFMCRSIDFDVQSGVIIPTGFVSEIDTPPSLSIGSNGHWGLYFDFITEFELKQDWTFGIMFGLAHLFPHSRTLRTPVQGEPAIYSAVKSRVYIEPGMTLKFSPYFTLGNMTDGLDFQVRYTYLRHNKDSWDNKCFSKNVMNNFKENKPLGSQMDSLSKWNESYITLEVSYDTKEAGKRVKLSPTVFATYDIPVSGNGVAKTHQFTVGVELHF